MKVDESKKTQRVKTGKQVRWGLLCLRKVNLSFNDNNIIEEYIQ
jgi:hypothetical protein